MSGFELLLREETPQVLSALVRHYGHFDLAEEAVQEALLAAAQQWPEEGVPDNPRGWLIRVGSRRLTDLLRSESARRKREENAANLAAPEEFVAAGPEIDDPGGQDDTLTLLFLCCHPALSPASQIALTLRAVGGLSTAQIAAAFLVPESTMAQRISRAKRSIKQAGSSFEMPPEAERDARMGAVLHVLYLIFNEGYTASSGTDLHSAELTTEAIRLVRGVRRLLPDDGEVAGLLALMLLTDARRPARTEPDGRLIPLAEQDRSRWNKAAIEEGDALVTDALSRTQLGPYQVQAAIAAVHGTAERAEDTDWPQIVALYQVLEQISDNPMVRLNHAVAVSMATGPKEGLALLEPLESDHRMTDHHRLEAVRAHLLEMSGDLDGARAGYLLAARRTTSIPERHYLQSKADRLNPS
ncbi:RNA polymerase sigma factor [Kribbella sp. VKM Ac-2568]|uniref:RNA polymerase sigma factor n=1 Tax=Kribbella sp. VKM Ac-2568 TaxID=2512219 RepID=UPI00104C9811|nr:RNA polymerase sigma factor [Kribbella sp. VKM Ac-2568]TCM49418.1 RNA polymerase sigma factor (sigma-70 family) [Kribbella sp. VKM Ac-2568]